MKLGFYFINCTILLVCFCGSCLHASDVFILVAESDSKSCFPVRDSSHLNYEMTPQEVGSVLEQYFSNKKNEKLYDAAIVNAGLKFCSAVEAKIVFSTILESFKRPNINQRQLEVGSNYFYTKAFQQEFKEVIHSKSTPHHQRDHLTRLKAFSEKAWGR